MSTFRSSVYSREGSQPSTPRANSISTRSSGNYSMFRDYSQHKITSTPPQPISPSLSNMYYTPQPVQNFYEPSTPRASSVSTSHRGSCGIGNANFNYDSSNIGNNQNDNYRYHNYSNLTFENSPLANSISPGSRLSGGTGSSCYVGSKMQAPATSIYSTNYETTTPRGSAVNGSTNLKSFQYGTPPQTASTQPVHMYYTPQPAQSLYEPSRERACSVGTSHRGGGGNCENLNTMNNQSYNIQSMQNEYLKVSSGSSTRNHAPTCYYPGQVYNPVETVISDAKTSVSNQYSSRDFMTTSNLHSTPQKAVTTNSPNVARSPSSRRGGARIRRPSMVHHPHAEMIHPQSPEYHGKLCVVLDLDETLVYSREGPVMQRPGCAEFLQSLDDIGAEVVVWTAGERDYAQDVLRRIDPSGIVQHCIYRHEKWWNGKAGYRKDLSNLGRQMDLVLFIDNTPDCLRGHENNSILVSDFTSKSVGDNVLYTLARVIRKYSQGNLPIANALASCEEIVRRNIKSDTIGNLGLFTLVSDTALESPSRQVRINRDLSSAAAAVASSAATRRSYRSTTPNPTISNRAAIDTTAAPLSSSSHTGWTRSVTPNMRSGGSISSGSNGMSFMNSKNSGSSGSMGYQSSGLDSFQNSSYGYGSNQSPHLVDRYLRSSTPTNVSRR